MGLAAVAARCRRGRFSRRRILPGSDRLAALALLWSLAGCGAQPVDNAADSAIRAPAGVTAVDQPVRPRIDCAPPGAAAFAPVCTFDEAETAKGVVLTLRHPDGGFRRLLITRDGRGVIAADGAETAKVTPLAPDRIEVALGGARYRLPAIVRGELAR